MLRIAFNISELAYKTKKNLLQNVGVGLEFSVNHVNRNSRGIYQIDLIYMCNYPPVIILLSYLFRLSLPTSS